MLNRRQQWRRARARIVEDERRAPNYDGFVLFGTGNPLAGLFECLGSRDDLDNQILHSQLHRNRRPVTRALSEPEMGHAQRYPVNFRPLLPSPSPKIDPPGRRVFFNPTVRFREIPGITSMPPEQKAAVWWSTSDMRDFAREELLRRRVAALMLPTAAAQVAASPVAGPEQAFIRDFVVPPYAQPAQGIEVARRCEPRHAGPCAQAGGSPGPEDDAAGGAVEALVAAEDPPPMATAAQFQLSGAMAAVDPLSFVNDLAAQLADLSSSSTGREEDEDREGAAPDDPSPPTGEAEASPLEALFDADSGSEAAGGVEGAADRNPTATAPAEAGRGDYSMALDRPVPQGDGASWRPKKLAATPKNSPGSLEDELFGPVTAEWRVRGSAGEKSRAARPTHRMGGAPGSSWDGGSPACSEGRQSGSSRSSSGTSRSSSSGGFDSPPWSDSDKGSDQGASSDEGSPPITPPTPEYLRKERRHHQTSGIFFAVVVVEEPLPEISNQ